MSWYEKECPTPFDTLTKTGLGFLVGDVIAERYSQEWARGKKYPLITFPSGTDREITRDQDVERIHLSGTTTVSLSEPYSDAVRRLRIETHQYGLRIFDDEEGAVLITQNDTNRGYGLRFDVLTNELLNIVPIPLPEEAMELLPGHLRAVLPPLYSQEKKGLDAIVPIKFFTPDANWTWYPTEFDGNDLFFGLVSGFEVELGYFSLTELEAITGPFHLPIERDLYFEPATLADLQARHQHGRYG